MKKAAVTVNICMQIQMFKDYAKNIENVKITVDMKLFFRIYEIFLGKILIKCKQIDVNEELN